MLLYGLNAPKAVPIKEPFYIEIYTKNGSHGQIKNVSQVKSQLSFNKKGQAHYYCEDIAVEEILLFYDASVVFTENGEWGQSVYAYSKNLRYKTHINGKAVNIQIHKNNDAQTTKIGFPIIYGSY